MADGSPDGCAFVSVCERLSSASLCWSYEEEVVARKLALVLHSELCRRRDSVFANNGRALLFSYSSDATSFLCRHQVSKAAAQGAIQRRGRHLDEFLCERGIFKSVGPSGINTAIVLRPPRILSAGKKLGNLFRAATDFFPLPRVEAGSSSILVSHFVFDRAVHAPLVRLLSARRNAFYSEVESGFVGNDRELAALKDIVVATGCSAHDASGALKWAMARWGTGETHESLLGV